MATVAVGLSDTRVNAFLKDEKRIPAKAKGQSRRKGGGGLLVQWCLYRSSDGGKGLASQGSAAHTGSSPSPWQSRRCLG